MIYLVGQIFLCLLAAFVLGAVFGWWARAGSARRRIEETERYWRVRFEQSEDARLAAQEEASETMARLGLLEEEVGAARAARGEAEDELARLRARLAGTVGADADDPRAALERELDGKEAEIAALEATVARLERAAGPAAARDDLKKIRGVGPALERLLNGLGITTFRQIAAWDEADVEWVSAKLGAFADRIRRDDWVAGARREHLRKYDERL